MRVKGNTVVTVITTRVWLTSDELVTSDRSMVNMYRRCHVLNIELVLPNYF